MSEREYIKAVTEYADTVYRIAFHHCANREDAEDIMQNVFLKLYRCKRKFQEDEDQKRWLIRVTVNECHSLFRTFWRSRRQEMEDYQWEQLTDEGEEMELQFTKRCSELYRAVMELPAKYRVSIFLYYYEEYSCKEIANILHCRETTVQTRLMRARKLLRQKLQEGFEDDE